MTYPGGSHRWNCSSSSCEQSAYWGSLLNRALAHTEVLNLVFKVTCSYVLLTFPNILVCQKLHLLATQERYLPSERPLKNKILFIFLERGREGEKERSMCGCLSHIPHRGPSPTTQACAPTGNLIGNFLVHRPALNPLSHTSQGRKTCFWSGKWCCSLLPLIPMYLEITMLLFSDQMA